MADWSLQLCQPGGAPLAQLTTARDVSLSWRRNHYAEVTLTLSAEDPAAGLLHHALKRGVPELRAHRHADSAANGTLRFRGHLALVRDHAEHDATITATFRSPFWRLLGDGSRTGRFMFPAPAPFVGVQAAQIAKQLVDTENALGATGLTTTGATEATVARDITYAAGTNIGRAIVDLSELSGGFDFFERPIDTGTALAELHIVAAQGINRTATVRFEHGEQTRANVTEFTRTISPPISVSHAIGKDALVSTQTAIAAHGRWATLAGHADVEEQPRLDVLATAALRPAPVRVVEFLPDASLAPKPFDDYWLGDTVRVLVRRAAIEEDVNVRINAITIVLDEDGRERFQAPDSTDEDASLTGTVSAEIAA
ncbi:MAG: hypothetical protein Q8O56_12825 [Solirubrobacteraceae bacterium]|nr:hypothetical protein [Solirubrobacteraceae bacterium]